MMKFHYPINLAIAGVLVVPTVALQSGSANSLEESLQRTLLALEHLTGIEQRVASGASDVVAEVLEWTEPTLQGGDDPATNDLLLEQLRGEVGALQAQVDFARQRTGDAEHTATLVTPPSAANAGVTAGTIGLDETTRRRLSGQFVRRPASTDAPASGAASATAEATPGETTKTPFEDDGYAANALLLGRALYRQKRYAEALETLKPHKDEAEGLYWMARCQEKLGAREEALEAYAAVIALADPEGTAESEEAHLARRAREDIEFLRWRIEFEKTEGGKRPQ